MTATVRSLLSAGAACALLAGCVSFGSEAPPQLLTLTSSAMPGAGSMASASVTDAIVVDIPTVERTLDQVRVPVQVSDSAIAYVKDAVWADKPARLFRTVLAETLAAKSGRLVLDQVETGAERSTMLSGQLQRFGYDEDRRAVIVRFDAVVRKPGSPLRKQRFEASVPVATVDAVTVGAALNQAANTVAAEVAAWTTG
ncbi:MAG: ABC transporter [Blastomonas sp. CACIA14H2]|uniref:ABC-type transport auxiliary lipoprotein family protein n=1 Tax=unclassified Blastomonas TaxID=2626550 RepID=UPI0003D05B93|nr:MAG: ABC transporter [Blastomonas sp. CACIA14H2]